MFVIIFLEGGGRGVVWGHYIRGGGVVVINANYMRGGGGSDLHCILIYV